MISAALLACAALGDLDGLRLNQLQLRGTHNSYHIQPKEPLFSTLTQLSSQFLALQYTHLPLDRQFEEEGIRQIELDVFADPDGGLYSERKVLFILGEDTASGIPELDEPGFKVLHVQDLDFETTCLTLIDCLQTAKGWSDAHPRHLPIMILIEAKDDAIPDPIQLGFTVPLIIGPEETDALDAEIRSVFPPDRMITPDDVRAGLPTLEEAVLTRGWPTLAQSRGRVLFTLDNGNHVRDAYLQGHPSLEGRVLFTSSLPGEPSAAFVKMNDPLADAGTIRDLVAAGYIVRTRADADLEEARSGDTTRRDTALSSGAQYISTDFPRPNPDLGTDYMVAIPGGIARCNPVNAPPECRSPPLAASGPPAR